MIKFKDMEQDDYDKVHYLFEEVANLHIEKRNDIFIKADPLSKKYFDLLIKDEDVVGILALIDDKVVGVSIFSFKLPDQIAIYKQRQIINIDTFCISKDYQKQGVGQALFNKTIDYAKICSVDAIELCVWQFNEQALNFYQKMNMKIQTYILELDI